MNVSYFSLFLSFFVDVEKACVPWQNDKEVKGCPTCQKKFTLTFRKHHCRLCGQIFCQFCFDYLEPGLASKNNVILLFLQIIHHSII